MTGAIGRSLILIALASGAVGSVLAFAAAWRRSEEAVAWAKRLAYAFAGAMILANCVMWYALLTHDFSVSYVAQVGSRSSPTWVTIVSLWSSLEGSILFWGLILGLYVAGATAFLGKRYPEYTPHALGVMLACGVFFAFLIAGPAHPFNTLNPAPTDGPGPNPLLQNHILMVVHPPMLYLGYVGMTVPFALACAGLLAGRLGHDFLKPLRFWLMIPWAFLTVGIVLGGWWAYEVLGWGGYWAWDPVENASLLPWLTATAALHSILVVERKGILKAWTLTLVMASFLLTILGTFMTRSGIFNSVHSFTKSDIGPTFLAFLAVGLVFSVGLLAVRMNVLEAEGRIEAARSRESMFLVNNLLFVLLTLTVLLGTVFPLVVEALQDKQISVGEPYFNRMAIPLGVAMLFLLGIGPGLPWGASSWAEVRRRLVPPLAAGAVLLGLGAALGARSPWLLATLFAAGYALHITTVEMLLPVTARMRTGSGAGRALATLLGPGRRRFGGYVVHVGVIVMFVAIGVSSTHKQHTEVSLGKGESAALGPYTMTFRGAEVRQRSHREELVALVDVKKTDGSVTRVEPRMNFYMSQREPIGTPEVLSTLKEDIYLSAMSIDIEKQRFNVRAFLNPMVIWIWIATALMSFGSLLALVPAGAKRRAEAPALSTARSEPAGAGTAAARTRLEESA